MAIFIAGGSVACSGLVQARAPALELVEPNFVRYETARVDYVDLVINVWERGYAVPGASASQVAGNLAAFCGGGIGHGPYPVGPP